MPIETFIVALSGIASQTLLFEVPPLLPDFPGANPEQRYSNIQNILITPTAPRSPFPPEPPAAGVSVQHPIGITLLYESGQNLGTLVTMVRTTAPFALFNEQQNDPLLPGGHVTVSTLQTTSLPAQPIRLNGGLTAGDRMYIDIEQPPGGSVDVYLTGDTYSFDTTRR